MNKRPLPSGLPIRPPYMGGRVGTPGPAPPLPAGPPPLGGQGQQGYGQHAQGQGQMDAAAHAAAWAAYYQSQGAAGAAYSAPAQPAPVAGPAAPGVTNPYANYGYGVGAQHANAATGYQAQPTVGPSQGYRPPQNAQAYATASTQPSLGGFTPQPQAQQYGQPGQAYTPPVGGAGYQTPQPALGPQQPRPPYQSPAPQVQQGYGWGATQAQQPVGQQAYRPPQPQVQPGYNAQQQQPYYPQGPQQQQPYIPSTQPFRPPQTPQPASRNQAYQPPGQIQARPPRPSMANTPPHGPGPGGGFPPAKRPRFDGPGGGMNGVGVAAGTPQNGMNHNTAVRPPSGPASMGVRPPPTGPAFGGGLNTGQPGFNAGVNRNVSGASSVGMGRGGAPIFISRPPIHLGRDGPPLDLAGLERGGAPFRGGLPSRGGAGAGRGGLLNVPRGPAGMRRGGLAGSDRSSLPPTRRGEIVKQEKEKERDKKRKEKEAKSTMMDFRIVGVEVKELGWSWGLIGGHQEDVVVKQEAETEKEGKAENLGDQPNADDVKTRKEEEEYVDEKGEVVADSVKPDAQEFSKEAGEGAADQGVGIAAGEEAKPESENGVVTETAVENDESGAEVVEEKRGEKRKAKSPEADEDTEGSSKKRSSTYFVTHRKPNLAQFSSNSETLNGARSSSASPFESSHNRFRIYFDSPPELDRIPKAARKGHANATNGGGGNKRGRRETSSVAPSRVGEGESMIGEPFEEEVDEQRKDEVSAPNVDQVEVSPRLEESADVPGVEVKQEKPVDQIPEVNGMPVVEASSVVQESEYSNTDTVPPETENSTVNVEGAEEPAEVEAIIDEQYLDLSKSAAESEPVEELGDVSMVTDPGATISTSTDEEPATVDAASRASPQIEVPPESVNIQPTVSESVLISAAEPTTEVNGQQESILGEGDAAESKTAVGDAQDQSGQEASAEEVAAAIAKSAENTASAYKTRARRQSSVSTVGEPFHSVAPTTAPVVIPTVPSGPSTNRLSILYEESSRRLCIDAEAVEKVRIWRAEGRIEVELKSLEEKADQPDDEEVKEGELGLPKGVLVESYDNTDQRFVSLTRDKLADLYAESKTTPNGIDGEASNVDNVNQNDAKTLPESEPARPIAINSINIPPFHRIDRRSQHGLIITVYMNKKNPLSEPKWCRTNSADIWLYEQFGSRKGLGEGWKGKLEIVDPDPGPTLKGILENWASNCSLGSPASRRSFISSLLSSPNDLLEILLRLTRGDRNPTVGSTSSSSSSSSGNPNQTFGPLATSVRSNSPYANHQTHVSLAILAMYRLTTDYATRAGEKKEVVEEKVGDIIKSLPASMIGRSLDGLFKEWQASEGK
ncbi:hypothetical protein IAR55_004660 [Kwoniella newhampshirensis]|uniref:Uncharacterized protein n=1 Tax=Kwoniella newhampshirensis TaxID=1651941 RepID=A0AAW0YVP0_9TREE